MKLPKLRLSRPKKFSVGRFKYKLNTDKYKHQLRRILPLLIAFGLGLMIGLVRNPAPASQIDDVVQAPVITEEDSAQAQAFSQRMVEYLRTSKCSQMYSEASLGFRVNASEKDWLKQCVVASSVLTGEALPLEHDDSNANDDVLEFYYQIAGSDDKTYQVLIQTINRDGTGWKLQGIDSQVQS